MLPHSRLWWFVLLVVGLLLLTTALYSQEASPARPAAPVPPPTVVAPAPYTAPVPPVERPALPSVQAVLLATLLLHVVATVVGLRAGMRIFYESVLFGGFLAILCVDALVVAAMLLGGPLTDGTSATLGAQTVVTALVMVITLHHFGFTKDRFTVMPAVLVAKAFGFFGEVVLRMLFLDSLLRFAVERGW